MRGIDTSDNAGPIEGHLQVTAELNVAVDQERAAADAIGTAADGHLERAPVRLRVVTPHMKYRWREDDSVPLALEGIDSSILDVRLLSALDLAVSKIGRFSSQDRDDIARLARRRLISSAALRRRAEEALGGYVGDTTRVQGSIELAVRVVADVEARGGKRRGK
jgi:hypothetical protein